MSNITCVAFTHQNSGGNGVHGHSLTSPPLYDPTFPPSDLVTSDLSGYEEGSMVAFAKFINLGVGRNNESHLRGVRRFLRASYHVSWFRSMCETATQSR